MKFKSFNYKFNYNSRLFSTFVAHTLKFVYSLFSGLCGPMRDIQLKCTMFRIICGGGKESIKIIFLDENEIK